jgi:hypothetical protein
MRSLYAEGRARDALATYQQARQKLADDLGLEPSPVLVDTERAVLTNSIEVHPRPWRSPEPQMLDYVRDHAVQLVYRTLGQGPTLILVSGTISFHVPITACWVDALAERATTVAFDPRGIGRSDPITVPCGLDERVADLLAVMRAAELESPLWWPSTTGDRSRWQPQRFALRGSTESSCSTRGTAGPCT